ARCRARYRGSSRSRSRPCLSTGDPSAACRKRTCAARRECRDPRQRIPPLGQQDRLDVEHQATAAKRRLQGSVRVTGSAQADPVTGANNYVASMATTLVLARHGETDWNREHRLQGWADPPLNELGREQARELAAALDGEQFDAVYSSDLQRAAETARIVARQLGVAEVVEDPSLREVDLGSWSGRLSEEVANLQRPDGESREQHRERVVAGVLRLATAHDGETLLIVSHGGSLRALETFATGDT